jgi:hypothetical protein
MTARKEVVLDLVRHAHLRVVEELTHQPTRDLLRRPPQLELRLDHCPQSRALHQLRNLRPASSIHRHSISHTGPITTRITIAGAMSSSMLSFGAFMRTDRQLCDAAFVRRRVTGITESGDSRDAFGADCGSSGSGPVGARPTGTPLVGVGRLPTTPRVASQTLAAVGSEE